MMSARGEAQLHHLPVLYQQTIQALYPKSPGFYVDCTTGAGGHARGILEASNPRGELLGLDVDPLALELARENLSDFSSRVTLLRASYVTLQEQLNNLGWERVDGILADLGASSMQFDSPIRGFSFSEDGPLDMRYDPSGLLSADDIVNELAESELADIIYKFGEERRSRQIARAIVQARPLSSTLDLAQVVMKVSKRKRGDVHPATRTFQAIRIEVNKELKSLEVLLPQTVEALSCGGRLAIISFHSLEDRIVKQFLRKESRDCICPTEQIECICEHKAKFKTITPRPIRTTPEEVSRNNRSRSARLRVAERI
jgi:16S rRNA (cytosine1402-N4)-methyltransferase